MKCYLFQGSVRILCAWFLLTILLLIGEATPPITKCLISNITVFWVQLCFMLCWIGAVVPD